MAPLSTAPYTGAVAAAVRFGVFDWLDDSGVDLAEHYERRLALVEHADRLAPGSTGC